MAKTTKPCITFTPTDYKPKRLASGLIGLRAPTAISVPPGGTVVVDLKTKADHALLFSDTGMLEPGKPVLVSISNNGTASIVFEPGEIIARAYPLFSQDFEIA